MITKLIEKVDLWLRLKMADQLINVLIKETKGYDSIVDLGCGYNEPIKRLMDYIPRSIGVDAFLPSIEKSKLKKTHSEFVLSDVLSYLKAQPDKSIDAAICISLIEHFEKKDGLVLLKEMERIARKKIFIYTPNGFVKQEPYDNNPWQEHKSGWGFREMKTENYHVYGFTGWKKLRGERALIKFRPRFFWKLLSYLSQLLVHRNPTLAFEILCIKTIH